MYYVLGNFGSSTMRFPTTPILRLTENMKNAGIFNEPCTFFHITYDKILYPITTGRLPVMDGNNVDKTTGMYTRYQHMQKIWPARYFLFLRILKTKPR